MNKTGWIITKDYCFGDYDSKTFKEVVIIGPHDTDLTEEELKQGTAFKMFDDDGILYYEGFTVADCKTEAGFMPLDHFGTPNAGAVEIQYYNKQTKKFETL